MAMDPDLMAVSPRPMARNPNIINSADPISRAVEVIRLVANIDVEGDGIGNTANAQYGHKKATRVFS
jgi:hypothetical protein